MAEGDNKKRLSAKSADYTAMSKKWEKATDFFAGEDAVIFAREKYLPKFVEEPEAEYNLRLEVAKFTNIYGDIVETLSAKPFSQEVKIIEPKVPPEQLKVFIEDVDGSGSNITVFTHQLFQDGVNHGMVFLFVDYPVVPSDGNRSVADEKALGVRPFFSKVLATNVYEIKSVIKNGNETLTYMRIYEPANGDIPEQYRELFNDDGVARFEIWRWNETIKDFTMYSEGGITIGVVPVVPIIVGKRDGKTWKVKLPMQAALDLQKTLYRAESNIEYTKLCAAFPMLVGTGVRPEKVGKEGKVERLATGPSTVLYAPTDARGTAGDWHYIEPAGSTLTFLKTDATDIKQDLRELGRQPLTANSSITVIQAAQAADKAGSAVKTWGISCNDGLTIAVEYAMKWYKMDIVVSTHIYDEYDDLLDPTADIGYLSSARTTKDISQLTYWEELQRRKVLSNDFTAERELERLLDEVPTEPPIGNSPFQTPTATNGA